MGLTHYHFINHPRVLYRVWHTESSGIRDIVLSNVNETESPGYGIVLHMGHGVIQHTGHGVVQCMKHRVVQIWCCPAYGTPSWDIVLFNMLDTELSGYGVVWRMRHIVVQRTGHYVIQCMRHGVIVCMGHIVLQRTGHGFVCNMGH